MKKNMKNKVMMFLLSMMLVIPFGSMSVYANNYVDSPYYFNFNTSSELTGFRPKQDDSYSYMNCKYASKPYSAHVVSRSTQTGRIIDCSYGHTYSFSTGTVYPMVNSVWENGYREAGIYATRQYGYSYNANGDWSPDSIGY